ncbi:MAG: TolC family protein [Desulfobulbaceae bacterium]|nr:TolC family protein [Desulfobulbaceae bacterium]
MTSMFSTWILKRIFFVLASICIFPVLLFAGEPPAANIVNLQEVLENITQTDPAILEALKQYQSVLAERSIATSEYYPTIGTELSTGPERTDGVDTNDDQENLVASRATLFARQNLFNGGKTTAFVEETDARIQAAAYEVLNVANRVYLDSAEAYINVVKGNELLQIAGENLRTQERIMRQVREKTEAGFSRVSELYNSESRMVLSKGSYISRQQDLNQALVIFHRQFGRLLRPEQFSKPEPMYQFPETLPETVEIAFRTHPALKVANYNIKTSRYTYEKALAAYYPTLDFELRGEYRSDTGGEEGETKETGGFLTLNYTFFDGGFREGRKTADQQSIRKEYQRAYIERRNVNETVRLAWNIMEAEDYKKEYLSEHVLLSAKTLDAFKEEYFIGRRTLLDLLNMENEYTDAQVSLTESHFSHLISLYRIMQATGVLLDEYDTGLRAMLNLAEVESYDAAEDYEDLDGNRDHDRLADISDQCDNSLPNSSVMPSGCSESDVSTTGYSKEEDSQLSPYIAPQAQVPTK